MAVLLFINYVDRGNMATAAHLMQGDLHLDYAQMGMLLSAFSWTYAWTQIPVGWLAERYGAHRMLAAGLTLWASATILMGFAHTFATLLVLRLLLGLGESAGFPGVAKILAAIVPAKGLGTANGIIALGYLTGPVVGTIAGGLLMAQFGWRSAFWVFGALSLLWLLPWSRVAGQVRTAVRAGSEELPTWWMILKQPSLWGTSLGLFSTNYVFYFMLSWLPSYLQTERGFSIVGMAWLATGAYLVNALSAFAAGWGIDRYLARGGSANVGYKTVMAVGAPGLGGLHAGHGHGLAGAWRSAACSFTRRCAGPPHPACMPCARSWPGRAASGRWVGIQNSLGNLRGSSRRGSPATSFKPPGITRTPSWWRPR